MMNKLPNKLPLYHPNIIDIKSYWGIYLYGIY